MSRLVKVVLLGLVLALVVAPVAAQEEGQDIIIDASFGQSIVNTLNPITYSSATESGLLGLMIPLLFTADPETAVIQPGVPGTFARDWTVSEDGTVITFELYDNYVWSDGTPVTAKDWEFVWDAVQSGQVETRLVFRTPYIAEMTAVDDYTLQVELLQPNCESISQVPQLPFPSHLFRGEDGSVDWQAVSEAAFLTPSEFLSVGPYQLSALANNEQIALVPLDSFPAGVNGNYETLNDGYVMKLVGSQTIVNEQILSGDVHFSDFVAPDARQAFIDSENIEYYEFVPGNTWDYLAVNHANPENPMPAYDEDGNLQEQDPHPIFGDVRVRRAIAHAINMDDVIEAALFGFGVNMPTMYAPGSWVDPEIPAREYNPELALELLAEAGWVDDDNDPSTPLVATEDALYAEPGTPFTFTLVTNDGNTRRTAFGQIVQDQLSEIGIAVDFQTIDFNVIIEQMDAQTFDALILGWQNGYPYSPDMTQLFGSVSDTIAGNNFMSWVNTDFDALQLEALSVPGCDPAERAAIYAQAAQIAYDDVAYIVQFGMTGFFAWNADLNNVDPFPANLAYNMTEWTFAP